MERCKNGVLKIEFALPVTLLSPFKGAGDSRGTTTLRTPGASCGVAGDEANMAWHREKKFNSSPCRGSSVKLETI